MLSANVKPAAFICPECHTALQLDRSKLPPGGARSRCPACKELVLIPALAASPAAVTSSLAEDVATRRFNVADLAPPPPLAEPPSPAETETVRFNVAAIGAQGGGAPRADEDSLATRRLSVSPLAADDDDVIDIEEEEPPPPVLPPPPKAAPVLAPTVDAAIPLAPRPTPAPAAPRDALGGSIPLVRPQQRTPSATRSRPPLAAEPAPAAKRGSGAGRVFAGLLLGALAGGGGGYLAIQKGLLTPPPALFTVPGGDAVSWSLLTAGAGALVGAVLGALTRGRR